MSKTEFLEHARTAARRLTAENAEISLKEYGTSLATVVAFVDECCVSDLSKARPFLGSRCCELLEHKGLFPTVH